MDVKNAKKTVPFDVPVNSQDIKSDIISIDNNYNDDVSINHQPQPRGVLARMQEKGLKISNYLETGGDGKPIRKDDE
jgi:hypothetical protein